MLRNFRKHGARTLSAMIVATCMLFMQVVSFAAPPQRQGEHSHQSSVLAVGTSVGETAQSPAGGWGQYLSYHHHCDSCSIRSGGDKPLYCSDGCLCPCAYCVAYQATLRLCKCADCDNPDCTCTCEPGTPCTCTGFGGCQPPSPPLCECGCGSLQSECDADGGCGRPECTCPGCQPPPPLCECGCGSLQSECETEGGCGKPECTCPGCQPPPPLCECGCGSLQSECDAEGGCGKPECTCPGCQPPPPLCECGCGSLQSECETEGGCGKEECTCPGCQPQDEEGDNPTTGGSDPPPAPSSGSGRDSGSSGGSGGRTGPDQDPVRPPATPEPAEPVPPEAPEPPPEVAVPPVQPVLSTSPAAQSSPVVETPAGTAERELPIDELEEVFHHTISVGSTTPMAIVTSGGEIHTPAAGSGANGTTQVPVGDLPSESERAITVAAVTGTGQRSGPGVLPPPLVLCAAATAAVGAGAPLVGWLRWRKALAKLAKEKW